MTHPEPAKRIQTLDVLRGFALLGILAVNAPYFAAPWQTAFNPTLAPLAVDAETAWSWFAPHVFFEMKCITLFSMLFGVSLYLVGGERDDREKGANLRRRLGWLLVFGLLHGALIWFGDILLMYAICGFIAMLARSWKPLTLIIVGVSLYAVSSLLTVGGGAAMALMPPETLAEMSAAMWAPSAEEIARITAAYQGGLISATVQNVTEWASFLQYGLIGFGPRTIGMMMIGLALFKTGFFSGRSPAWVYLIFVVIGLVALALVAWQAQLNYAAEFDFIHFHSRGSAANALLSPLITLLYASLLILLVKWGGVFKLLTGALAPVGRMAFTNYLTQSLIMTTIFWGGRGFGLFGEVTRPQLIGIVVAIWVLQLIWSPLWLSRFKMGPLEWVWRRLTYKGDVALLNAAPAR